MGRRHVEIAMVSRSLAVAVVCISSAASLSWAHAETRGVIELFTSQGCSSCPAADKLVGELALDRSLVSLSLPIDYWDYLGWKDTLADPRNTARQKAYSKVRGDREVYTPQAVVNGSLHALGSDQGAIEKAIAKSRQNATILSLPVTLSIADGRLTVAVPDGNESHSGTEVWICGVAKAVTVAIKRGENQGKTITYHNVARRWMKLDSWNGKERTWTVPLREFGGEGVDAAAVMLQKGTVEKPNAVVGAAFASLH
jgi:hypothetical protein